MSAPQSLFERFAGGVRPELEEALFLALPALGPEALSSALADAVLSPGKRLRPLVALAAGDLTGASRRAALAVAVAVEFVHSASLVLDDLPSMDNATRRRGRPALHLVHGAATAELVAVSLVGRAFEVVAEAPEVPASVRPRLSSEIAAAVQSCCAGQAADLAADPVTVRLDDLEAIHSRKTGALFIAAIRAGALAGGVREPVLDALTRFGRNLGLAFQITDDLLDLEGNEQEMGKDRGRDAHKANFALLLGAASCRRLVAELLEAAVDALAPIGRKADVLADLPTLVRDRRS